MAKVCKSFSTNIISSAPTCNDCDCVLPCLNSYNGEYEVTCTTAPPKPQTQQFFKPYVLVSSGKIFRTTPTRIAVDIAIGCRKNITPNPDEGNTNCVGGQFNYGYEPINNIYSIKVIGANPTNVKFIKTPNNFTQNVTSKYESINGVKFQYVVNHPIGVWCIEADEDPTELHKFLPAVVNVEIKVCPTSTPLYYTVNVEDYDNMFVLDANTSTATREVRNIMNTRGFVYRDDAPDSLFTTSSFNVNPFSLHYISNGADIDKYLKDRGTFYEAIVNLAGRTFYQIDSGIPLAQAYEVYSGRPRALRNVAIDLVNSTHAHKNQYTVSYDKSRGAYYLRVPKVNGAPLLDNSVNHKLYITGQVKENINPQPGQFGNACFDWQYTNNPYVNGGDGSILTGSTALLISYPTTAFNNSITIIP